MRWCCSCPICKSLASAFACAQGYKLRSRLLQLREQDPLAVLPEHEWQQWLAVSAVQCSAVPGLQPPVVCGGNCTVNLPPALFWSASLLADWQ